MTDAEIALRDVTQPAALAFADEQRQLIRHTVAPSLTPAEFDLFLDIAARHQLNPLTGEIWAAKMPGRNGDPGKLTAIVGRDGFLAIANRSPDFEGMDHDVVRANDSFVKNPDGTFSHSYDMSAGKDRGDIVGAYCIVYRRGRRPTPFFAAWGEYNTGQRAWKSHPSAMILKCAMANALRLAYNLSGLYSDAEMDRLVTHPEAATELEPDFGEDELGEKLRGLVEAANAARPGSYRPAKVRMILAHATDRERQAFAESLERFLAEEAGVVPGDAVEEAEVVDPPADDRTADDLEQAIADAEAAADQSDDPDEKAEWLRLADSLREQLPQAA